MITRASVFSHFVIYRPQFYRNCPSIEITGEGPCSRKFTRQVNVLYYLDRKNLVELKTRESKSVRINLQFLGAAGNVTGSCYLLETEDSKLLVDCGLYQERKFRGRNWHSFPVNPERIDIVLLTHTHLDYCGLLPKEMLALLRSNSPPFYFSTLFLTRSTGESKAINRIKSSCIIIAGSGMCTGGRIKHHLINNISRVENTVLFIGYQAKETLGRHILSGAGKIRIHGKIYPVKARIEQISGFSAHADKGELLKWLAGFQFLSQRLFIVHGEEEVAVSFFKAVAGSHRWSVLVPRYLDKVSLN